MFVALVVAVAAVAVLAMIVVVAVGRGGELAETHPDYPASPLPFNRQVAGTDAALLRLPLGLCGYQRQITDEALERFAYALTERDTRIAVLETQLAETRRQLTGDQTRQQPAWLTSADSPWPVPPEPERANPDVWPEPGPDHEVSEPPDWFAHPIPERAAPDAHEHEASEHEAPPLEHAYPEHEASDDDWPVRPVSAEAGREHEAFDDDWPVRPAPAEAEPEHESEAPETERALPKAPEPGHKLEYTELDSTELDGPEHTEAESPQDPPPESHHEPHDQGERL